MDCVMRNVTRVEKQLEGREILKYLGSFKIDCQLRNLSPKTIDVYFERIGYFAAYLDEIDTRFENVDRAIVQRYIVSLKGTVSDETINGRIRTLRCLFNYLDREGLWDGKNPLDNVKLLKTAKRIKPVVSPEDIQRILRGINRKTFEGNRNFVMLLLFWDGMLRLKELTGLRTDDVNLGEGYMKVFGKGRKERIVPIGMRTAKHVQKYLVKWRKAVSGDLLVCMRNGEPIKDRHCHKIVQRLGAKHKIRLYPHLLRHSAATHFIKQGGNVAVVSKILGHTSLTTTENYLHLKGMDLLQGFEKFSPVSSLRI